MSIIRVIKNRDNPYLIMNKTGIYDKRLSLKAKGLLCYLLSKPDNWFVNTYEIVSNNSDGKYSVLSAMKELIKFGYMHRHQFRKDDGRYLSFNYLVYENPNGKPYKMSSSIKTNTQPKPGFRDTDNQPLLINKTKKLIKQQQHSTLNKSNTNVVAVDNFVLKNNKTETILLLKELKIRNIKKIFALYSLSCIFKYASWIKYNHCKMKNPTGFLITAIKEKWLDNLDSDSDDNETLLFYYKCLKCGKVFAYVDPIRNYVFCNKCGGIY